jgi:membrane protein implicated in regulation of membrane protease activity
MIYIIILGVMLIILEVLTPGIFFFLTLGLAVITNSITYAFTKDISITLIGVAITTAIYYYIIKKFNIFSPKNNYKSNIDSYIGKEAVVEEVIREEEYRVKVFSEIWTATSEEKLVVGDVCIIKDRKNNTLVLSKK